MQFKSSHHSALFQLFTFSSVMRQAMGIQYTPLVLEVIMGCKYGQWFKDKGVYLYEHQGILPRHSNPHC